MIFACCWNFYQQGTDEYFLSYANVNKHLFTLEKLWVEIKCIFERKEYRSSLRRNISKGIWVSNNSLRTEEIFISSLIYTI